MKPEDPRKKGSGVFFGHRHSATDHRATEKDSRPLFPGRRSVLPPAGTAIAQRQNLRVGPVFAWAHGEIGEMVIRQCSQIGCVNRSRVRESSALVLGRWHLTRAGEDFGGSFSVMFRLVDRRVLKVYDHTSVMGGYK